MICPRCQGRGRYFGLGMMEKVCNCDELKQVAPEKKEPVVSKNVKKKR